MVINNHQTPTDKRCADARKHIEGGIIVRSALLILALMLIAPASVYDSSSKSSQTPMMESSPHSESIKITPNGSMLQNLLGLGIENGFADVRTSEAWTHIGKFTVEGLERIHTPPVPLQKARSDLVLLIVDGNIPLPQVRAEIQKTTSATIHDFIAPSGFTVQGSSHDLVKLRGIYGVAAVHSVPLDFLLDPSIWESVNQGESFDARVDGWRDAEGHRQPLVRIGEINHRLSNAVPSSASAPAGASEGRFDVLLNPRELTTALMNPAVAWVGPTPHFGLHNSKAVLHMDVGSMRSKYATTLDGAGELIAIADSGLDSDHGDFGTRVHAVKDVINDGDTSDSQGGHGTHVACSALGDGSRGGYAGTAPGADVYFQAMMRNWDGAFMSPSLDSLLRTAYNDGARIHTNSWGSQTIRGSYTTEAQDLDSRSYTYDRVTSGYSGFTILFANGNDGDEGSGSVGAPATAKNSISIGNHHNRGGSSPNKVSDSSSRGPTDDGRIKPDVVAPGTWVRSCKAQEMTDSSSASWEDSSGWYIEFSGTSMAAPHAAGLSAILRQYLMDEGGRPSPQGSLIKAMMILGAVDIGTRDIPNNVEGWGRVNLKETLDPGDGRTVWVDDRTSLSSGQWQDYPIQVDIQNRAFKAVLTWSDYRGSTSASKALVNNLDLEVIDPSGVVYRGNDFQNGKSLANGNGDNTNNVEVVLVDYAKQGTWTVRVRDSAHGGPKAQMFSIAIAAQGADRVLPDVVLVPNSLTALDELPERGKQTQIAAEVRNTGNGELTDVRVSLLAGSQTFVDKVFDMGPGTRERMIWDWTPSTAGPILLRLNIDPSNQLEEGNESNNILENSITVADAGVRVESDKKTIQLTNSSTVTSSWDTRIRNSAMRATNGSVLVDEQVFRSEDGAFMPWSVSLSKANFTLSSLEEDTFTVYLSHAAAPSPGTYVVRVKALDLDAGLSQTTSLYMMVGIIPAVRIDLPPGELPVHPVNSTTFEFKLTNLGNAEQGYDMILEPPLGWSVGFDEIGSHPNVPQATSGALNPGGSIQADVSIQPPHVMPSSGSKARLDVRIISQMVEGNEWTFSLDLVTERHDNITLDLKNGNLPRVAEVGKQVRLVWTIENIGNSEIDSIIETEAPLGWEITGPSTLIIDRNGNPTIIFDVLAVDRPLDGDFSLRVVSRDGSELASGTVPLLVSGTASIEFKRLIHADDTYDENAADLRPIGRGEFAIIRAEVYYDGSAAWHPQVTTVSPPGWSVDCDPLGSVDSGTSATLDCGLLISDQVSAGDSGEIIIELSSGGTSANFTFTIASAIRHSVIWRVIDAPQMTLDETAEFAIQLENTGEGAVIGPVLLQPPSGWIISPNRLIFDPINPGDSALLEFTLKPTTRLSTPSLFLSLSVSGVEGGEQELSLRLSPTAPNQAESSVSASEDDGEWPLGIIIFLILVLLGIASAIAYVLVQQKSNHEPPQTSITFPHKTPWDESTDVSNPLPEELD